MKPVAAWIALFLLSAAPALAGFTDPANQFSVEFPTGWSAPTTDKAGSQSNAPGGQDAFCRANANLMASLEKTSQKEINTSYGEPLDQATWAAVLSIDAAKLKLIAHEARIVDGHVVQLATIEFASDVVGWPATARFSSHILPGRMVNAGCFAPSGSWSTLKQDFEKVVTSLKPS